MANKDKQPLTLAFTWKETKEAGEGREPMWTWREHANSSQHRKAPDTTKYDPRIILQRGSATSDSSLEVDSGPFEWMLLASSLNHQITAYLLWGENENRVPWHFQISALHFRPSLGRVGFLFEQLATAVTLMRQRKWFPVLKYCGGNAFIIQ